nr:hypothetical protein A6C57_22110 [Fibrella sp. ES10-3-2-2]
MTLPQHVTGWNWNDFESYEQQPVTVGALTITDGSLLEVFIETGSAFMILIYGVMTLTKLARYEPGVH